MREDIPTYAKPFVFNQSGGIHSLAHEYGHALDYIMGGHIEQSRNQFALTAGPYAGTKVHNWNSGPDTMRGLMGMIIYSYIFDDSVKLNTKTKKETPVFSKSYENIAGETEYYRRHNEIFARLFEKYIHYKLEKLQIKNTTLTKNKYDRGVYATEKDFKRILPYMDMLVEKIRGVVVKNAKVIPIQKRGAVAASKKQLTIFNK